MKPILHTMLVALTLAASGRAATRPNIVFFLVDDMGWQETSVPFHTEATPLNQRYRTPAMERMAREGLKFTQAYASAVCSPTRVSAISGMNAARHRVTNWTLRRNESPDQYPAAFAPPAWNLNGICTNAGIERTTQVTPLPQLLREAGYRTLHVGKAHFGAKDTPGADPRNLGFDVNIAGHAAGGPGSYWAAKNFSARWRGDGGIWDVPGLEAYHGQDLYLTEALTREAVREVERAVSDKTPFYLYFSHYAVHAPWEKDDRFYGRYIEAGLKPAEATLASMIEGMDRSLGDLMDTLERLHVLENTVIIFMSDNGSPSQCPANRPLRGHKLSPYEGGIRVPMLVRWPGVAAAAGSVATPVLVDDIFPTLLSIAGVDAEGKLVQTVDGHDLVPLIRGGEAAAGPARDLVWHFPHVYNQKPYSVLRSGEWKLIYFYLDARMELFNVATDLSEQRNLAAEEPARVRRMASTLGRLLRERDALRPLRKADASPLPWPDEAVAAAPGNP